MTAGELSTLGRYIYGEKWAAPLAGDLGVSPRMVRYWAAGAWPMRQRHAIRLIELARARNQRRVAQERHRYLAMAEAMPTGWVRARLVAAG